MGGAAGWYPPPRTPMSAKKKTIIEKVWERPTKNPAKATPQIPIVRTRRGPVRSASQPAGSWPIP